MLKNRLHITAMVTLACIAAALAASVAAQTASHTVRIDASTIEGVVSGGGRRALVEQAAETQTPSQNAPDHLGGTSWQLVKFQGSDDKTPTPDDRAKYTIAFGTDGSVSVRLDCNRGRGTWNSSGPHQLEFGPLALTRAMCPPGSLHDRMAKDWGFVRSYLIKDGHLFLALMADGGIYEFEPIGGS